MADIQLLIEVIGEQDMVRAIRTAQKMESEYRALDRAFNKGKISAQQYAKGVQQIDAKVDALSAAFKQANIALEQHSDAMRSATIANNVYSQSAAMTGKGTNRLGVVFQQTGYQVGDFFVQIQSGTHYMVALGQQLTQLVGTFGMLSRSTRMIALFSGLGIAVPIITAVAGAFLRARKSAREVEEDVVKLSEAIAGLDRIQRATALSLDRNLTEAFNKNASAVGRLLKRLNELDFKAAMKPVKDELDKATIGIERVKNALDTIQGFKELERQGQRLDIVQKALLADAEKLVRENLLLALQIDKVRDAFKAIGESKSTEQLIERIAKARDLLKEIDDPAAQEALAALEKMAKEAGISEAIMKRLADAARDVANEMSRAASEAINFVSNLGTASLAGLKAEVEALSKGLPLPDVAAEKRRAEIMADPRFQKALKGPEGVRQKALEGLEAEVKLARDREILLEKRRKLLERLRDNSGGGGGVSALEERKQELLEAKRAVDALRASYDKAYETELKIADAQEKVNRLIELNPALTEEANQVLKDYIASIREAENPMKKIAETMRDALGDAFMSIVEGAKSAKEAFKDMARAILKQAFDLLVIQPIMDGLFGRKDNPSDKGLIGSIFGMADGGAFERGVKLTAYANGGVVTAPTGFLHSGGLGVMGEAGPEAIMPLKRGKNGKLGVQVEGGLQPVVINQSFHFSANGDDSVKRIIAQEAPKIAQLTQKQILESRARGGAFRTTFGA